MNCTNLGIDLGTTNSCVSIVKKVGDNERQVHVAVFNDSKRTMPSYVSYNEKTDEIIVGSAAKNNITTNYHNTVYDSKRMIGLKYDKIIKNDMSHWPFEVVEHNGNPYYKVKYNNRVTEFAPEDVSGELLRKLKLSGDDYAGNDPSLRTKAVVTIPAYFKNSQRVKTYEAIRKSGLDIIRIINEPTAAAIGYCYENRSNDMINKNILIYDFGGGTFDISIAKINYQNNNLDIQIIATGGDNHLGGRDIDNNLVDYFVNLLKEKKNIDLTQEKHEKKLIKLRRACEELKVFLSSASIGNLDCEFYEEYFEDNPENIELTAAKFNRINSVLFEKTLDLVKQLLKDVHLDKSDIHDVVLVGGSSRITYIKTMLMDYFGKPGKQNINPDEIVAVGAAIVASEDLFTTITFTDITTYSLSTDENEDDVVVMIPRFHKIPCEDEKTFANAYDDQEYLDIMIFEGEGTKQSDNTILDKFELHGIPKGKAGTILVNVKFSINKEGILTVTAKAEGNGVKKDLVVTV